MFTNLIEFISCQQRTFSTQIWWVPAQCLSPPPPPSEHGHALKSLDAKIMYNYGGGVADLVPKISGENGAHPDRAAAIYSPQPPSDRSVVHPYQPTIKVQFGNSGCVLAMGDGKQTHTPTGRRAIAVATSNFEASEKRRWKRRGRRRRTDQDHPQQ